MARWKLTVAFTGMIACFLLAQSLLLLLFGRLGNSGKPFADVMGNMLLPYLLLLFACIAAAGGIGYLLSGRFSGRWTIIGDSDSHWLMDSFIQYSTDAIYLLDTEARILEVNLAFEKMYGFHADEIQGKKLPVLPGLEEETPELIARIREGGQVTALQTVRRTKDGRDIHVSITLSPIVGQRGEIVAFASIDRDISEHKETEEMLRRSEKLSIVGQLAAGVAHEIRNPLTTLRGFVQLQKERKLETREYLDVMLSELDRINFFVSEFMILAKPQMEHFQDKNISSIMTDLLELMEPQTRLHDIVVETRFEDGLHPVRCLEHQIRQVFFNVLKNGMEAMPDGGEISVDVRNLDNKRVMVRIADHGEGIPEEHLLRLGEPFFSSKENATGLGLMISQHIVANHSGSMLIRSELGKGTCVDIVLPVQ